MTVMCCSAMRPSASSDPLRPPVGLLTVEVNPSLDPLDSFSTFWAYRRESLQSARFRDGMSGPTPVEMREAPRQTLSPALIQKFGPLKCVQAEYHNIPGRARFRPLFGKRGPGPQSRPKSEISVGLSPARMGIRPMEQNSHAGRALSPVLRRAAARNEEHHA